jgi:hypothetical protein
MKLNEFLREKILIGTKKRLASLVVISAPQVMLKGIKNQIRDLESGKDFKVKGDIKYLEYDFVSETWKTGRGGKKYVEFTLKNGDKEEKVNYFPNAKYGRYIKAVNCKD